MEDTSVICSSLGEFLLLLISKPLENQESMKGPLYLFDWKGHTVVDHIVPSDALVLAVAFLQEQRGCNRTLRCFFWQWEPLLSLW